MYLKRYIENSRSFTDNIFMSMSANKNIVFKIEQPGFIMIVAGFRSPLNGWFTWRLFNSVQRPGLLVAKQALKPVMHLSVTRVELKILKLIKQWQIAREEMLNNTIEVE